LGKRLRCFSHLDIGLNLLQRSGGRPNPRFGLGDGARIEQRRIGRLDDREQRFPGDDFIAWVERDAKRAAI
jgi:hypothetical protein